MSSKDMALSNELFDFLSQRFGVLAVLPTDVKDKFSISFGIYGKVFTAIILKEYYERVVYEKREISFRTELVNAVTEFARSKNQRTES